MNFKNLKYGKYLILAFSVVVCFGVYSHALAAQDYTATSTTILLYHLENLTDSSGHGYDLTNVTSVPNVAAYINNGYQFNGTAQNLENASSNISVDLNNTVSSTYSIIFKPSVSSLSVGQEDVMLQLRLLAGGTSITKIYFEYTNIGGMYKVCSQEDIHGIVIYPACITLAGALDTSQFYNFIMSNDASNAITTVYLLSADSLINSNATGTYSTAAGTNSSDEGVHIGGFETGGNYILNFHGIVDEVIAERRVAWDATRVLNYQNNYFLGGGGGGASSTATLYWPSPVNTSSTPYPDFDNWAVQLSNVTSTQTYYMQIQYTLLSSTDPQQPANDFQTFNNYSAVTPTTSSTFTWTFPKKYQLVPGANLNDTFGWWITFNFGNSLSDIGNLSSSSAEYFFRYLASAPTSTQSTYAGTFTSTSTNQQMTQQLNNLFGNPNGCAINTTSTYSIWNPSDWRCIVLQLLGDAASSTINYVGGAPRIVWHKIQETFPINFFAAGINAIDIAANPTSSEVAAIYFPWPYATSTLYVFMSSSTTNDIKNHTGWDYKDLIDKVAYIITAILILGSAAYVIKYLSPGQE